MSNNPKVSARPPEKKEFEADKMLDLATAFIKDGDVGGALNSKAVKKVYPWENARDDVYKVFNLRLPEGYAAKLDYIAMKLNHSKQSICLNVVKQEIDKILERFDDIS